ncbi:hypothetical protein BDB01DRAFT_831650 [Pilobolus umbonatus]|nr:hypothetical protein BDB01DRAFT_831650 [Pilobolus umbonatus]
MLSYPATELNPQMRASMTPISKKPVKETRMRTLSQNATIIPKIEQRQNNTTTAKPPAVNRTNTANLCNSNHNRPHTTLKARESRNGRRSSDDKLKSTSRPQSPPSKRNDSPSQQPTIMLESVQRQLQQEQGGEDTEDERVIVQYHETTDSTCITRKHMFSNTKDTNKLKPLKNEAQCNTSPPPSPPATPAATVTLLSDFSKGYDIAAGMIPVQDESIHSSMCITDAQNNKLDDFDKQSTLNQCNPSFCNQPPLQRIHRLRPAASFATLRQLANTKNAACHPPYQPQQLMKKRPTSCIDCHSTSPNRSFMADEFLSVNRPIYIRRASHEDHHIHFSSDNSSNSPLASSTIVSNGRRLIRSNTVQPIHNLIIKDGQGHRIIQCVELDQPQQILIKKKNDSFGSHEPLVTDMANNSGMITPTDLVDESSILYAGNQFSDDYQHSRHYQTQDMNDTSSSDSGSPERGNHGCTKKARRKDSVKSVSSVCSNYTNTTTLNTHFQHSIKCEQLKYKLDNERLIVKSLQKQKEACNKDILFLSKNTDDLITENAEWKKKYETEKMNGQKYLDDLAMTKKKLNEAVDRIRHLDSQNKVMKLELEHKEQEIEEYQKKKPRIKSLDGNRANDRLISAQLHHSQNQVRLLKSTMEQFLRMGVFNDDLNLSLSSITSPTISVESVVSELRYDRCRRGKHVLSNAAKPHTLQTKDDTMSTNQSKEDINNDNKDAAEKKKEEDTGSQDLDTQLRELLREKEILQAEYSKAPSSGGNALARRRREELETRLDDVDSQMSRIKLKMRNRNII